MVSPIILLLFSLFLSIFLLKNRNGKKGTRNSMSKLPGPKHYPIIGCALEFNLPMEGYYHLLMSVPRHFGNRVYIWSVGIQGVGLWQPDDIEKLLSSPAHINKGSSYNFLHPWLAEGLLTSKGQKWQSRRKLLTPAFHFRILEDFLGTLDKQAQVLVQVLKRDFSHGEEKNICPYIYRCALDIIGETAMGIKFYCQESGDTSYLRAVETACEMSMYRAVRPHLWLDIMFKMSPSGRKYHAAVNTLHDFTDKVIQERKDPKMNKTLARKLSRKFSDEIYWNGRRRMAFLDLILEAQKDNRNELTDKDIREEVNTFMFTGHDTSSTSLNWTIFLLGLHPGCQAKVQEELDGIFGGDKTREILTKDLAHMNYLEMCIKESLRLFPLVPVMTRRTISNIILDSDLIIPPGVDIGVLTMVLHRNEKFFPNPEIYDPDRFNPENSRGRHPYAFIPFSAGPRNCIGQKFAMMETKVILANIFRNFKVEAAERLEDVVIMIEVMTRPRDGLKIRLTPR